MYTDPTAILFEDLYCKGHGRPMTVQRFIDVCQLTEEDANDRFDQLYVRFYGEAHD